MANTLDIKRNDTKPFVQATVQDATGSALDLTNGSYVFFNMATNDNTFTPVFSGAGGFITKASGTISYEWAAGNTARSGTYLGEFEITYTDGTLLTVPSDHSFVINIYEDYDGN